MLKNKQANSKKFTSRHKA